MLGEGGYIHHILNQGLELVHLQRNQSKPHVQAWIKPCGPGLKISHTTKMDSRTTLKQYKRNQADNKTRMQLTAITGCSKKTKLRRM
jgi:hypothetical protein